MIFLFYVFLTFIILFYFIVLIYIIIKSRNLFSAKSWSSKDLVLFCLFCFYLVFGAALFCYVFILNLFRTIRMIQLNFDHKTGKNILLLFESKFSRFINYDYQMILSLMGLRMIHRVLFERHSFFLVHASSAFLVVYEVPML